MTLFRLLLVLISPLVTEEGKLDTLPRPGLRVYLGPERESEARLLTASSLEEGTGPGVGVGVAEPSDPCTGGGGGLEVPEVLALAAAETGESLDVPLVTDSAAWMLTFVNCSVPVGDSLLLGTSKLLLGKDLFSVGLVTFIGNRLVSDAPLERSLRWFRGGAGLWARLRSTIARFRASMAARRLLSSELIARGRLFVRPTPVALDCRFNSPKIASLWVKRSWIRR